MGRRQASRRPGGLRANLAGVRALSATIFIVGAGAWGTALAAHLARRDDSAVTLFARDAAQAAAIGARRVNDKYLPGIALPESLLVTASLATAAEAALLIVATPVAALPDVVRDLAGSGSRAPLFWLSKGFVAVPATAAHPVGVALPHQHLAPLWRGPVGAISGPSFADEVARGLPTAVAVAATEAAAASSVASLLRADTLRAYESDDLAGVEVAGAVKNVLAIAAGASDGLGFGHNARAALITRGLAEVGRLCAAMGGRRETMMGLAGLGDLVLTCTGDLSRNRRVGLALARGASLAQALAELGHVAEGVPAAAAVRALSTHHRVEMPICDAVHRVVHEGEAPRDAVLRLLQREPRPEGH
jgi:glycerol-3-phosphate dehydrogenase (NAD(P)+)